MGRAPRLGYRRWRMERRNHPARCQNDVPSRKSGKGLCYIRCNSALHSQRLRGGPPYRPRNIASVEESHALRQHPSAKVHLSPKMTRLTTFNVVSWTPSPNCTIRPHPSCPWKSNNVSIASIPLAQRTVQACTCLETNWPVCRCVVEICRCGRLAPSVRPIIQNIVFALPPEAISLTRTCDPIGRGIGTSSQVGVALPLCFVHACMLAETSSDMESLIIKCYS